MAMRLWVTAEIVNMQGALILVELDEDVCGVMPRTSTMDGRIGSVPQ